LLRMVRVDEGDFCIALRSIRGSDRAVLDRPCASPGAARRVLGASPLLGYIVFTYLFMVLFLYNQQLNAHYYYYCSTVLCWALTASSVS
jgi:hypothetical protein